MLGCCAESSNSGGRGSDMGPRAPSADLSVRGLPPNIFAAVMATGIVSLALNGTGYRRAAIALFWLNLVLYAVLSALLLVRALRHRDALYADLISHARAPGFFTLTAAPCILGNQCVLLLDAAVTGLAFWVVGFGFWLVLSYGMLPRLMDGDDKPKAEAGLSGAWLLVVVATQAISVLACLLAPPFTEGFPNAPVFVALTVWLVGIMLYIWLIAQIFHRIVFLPLSPDDLAPPYWINMGAMAISTLAGVRLVAEAGRTSLLGDLLPFLKGMTLLFWATATWWIPILLALGCWRHLYKRVPLTYEHGYWAAVFPLGMYTVCTQNLIRVFQLPFLELVAMVFVWIALGAWGLTFAGLVWHLIKSTSEGMRRLQQGRGERGDERSQPGGVCGQW